jgi:hypothetical protein
MDLTKSLLARRWRTRACTRRRRPPAAGALVAARFAPLLAAVVLAATTAAPAIAGASPATPAPETGHVATHGVPLAPNDALPRPSWWNGSCDVGNDPSSYKLAANFDGLQDCGHTSGDYLVRFFPGAWGEYEWECVELSMRWMYLAWGVKPYGANGNGVVPNYPNGAPGYPTLAVVKNGTAGEAPQPGDVLSIDNSNQFGHTEVAASTSVNGDGDGTVTAISENDGPGASGWATLTVKSWVVTDGIPGDVVVGWLHNPAWTLEQPVSWKLTSTGDLSIQDSGGVLGPYVTVATGIARAGVIGGDGYSPAPIVVALTTSGELEGGYYLPGIPGWSMAPIASGVKSFALSAGPGVSGRPVLGWVTDQGEFEIASGGLLATPVEEAAGVTSIAIAPDSDPANSFIGYVSTAGVFYDRQGAGALVPTSSWRTVATGVTSIRLGGGDLPTSDTLEAYTSAGTFYARQGMAGTFTAEATSVTQMAVTTIGSAATPLLAYLSEGRLEVAFGPVTAEAFVVQDTGVSVMSVAAGTTSAGFPIVGAVTAAGLEMEDGALGGHWTHEGAAALGGVASLTVS